MDTNYNTKNILDLLVPIFHEVFDDEDIVIDESTNASCIDGWDSLAQIRLVVSIEKFFKINFTAHEVSLLENVGELLDLILEKLS